MLPLAVQEICKKKIEKIENKNEIKICKIRKNRKIRRQAS